MSPALRRPAVLAHVATLAAAGVALLYMGRNFWFHFDEWDIVGNHNLGLLRPHNEHWSTLPYLAYRTLYPVFGLRQYLPYLAIVIVLHVGVAHLLWRILRSQAVSEWPAMGLVTAFLALGAGAENLVWAWQMGFVGSVFFGYAAVRLAATPKVGRRGDAGAAAALLAAVMCSGIGLVMVLVAAVAVILQRGWRTAAALASPAAVAFATWYATFGHTSTSQVYARPSLGGSLAFAWVGMTSAAEMGSGLRWLGAPLVVGVAGWLAWQLRRAPREHPVAVAGTLGFMAMFALISTGRLQYGPESARQSRYIYVAVALLIPLTGVVLQRLVDRGRLGRAIAALLVGWAFLHGARVLVLSESQHRGVTANTRRLVLAAAAGLDQPGSTPDMGLRPDPVAAPTLNLGRIAGFKRDGALPSN